jgi:hypothetical protein
MLSPNERFPSGSWLNKARRGAEQRVGEYGEIAWPRPALRHVPAQGVAERLAQSVASQGPDSWDPLVLVERLQIPVRYQPLRAAEGGLEATIISNSTHGFEIVCDEWLPDQTPDRLRFRVAHELAHTLFFDWANNPPRRVNGWATAEEERFCDEFAEALLAESKRLPPSDY